MISSVIRSRFWEMVAFLGVLSGSAAGYSVIGKRITGVYGGLAVMRCSLIPDNITIEFIEWRMGRTFEGPLLYLDKVRNHHGGRRMGIFKGRNVTGHTNIDKTSYELNIHNANPDDDRFYFCRIQPKNEHQKKGTSVKLTLVAPPDSQPVITDASRVAQTTSNCKDDQAVPIVRGYGDRTFTCDVGGSKPCPKVTWIHEKGSNVMEPFSQKYQSRGVQVEKVARHILISNVYDGLLKCIVTVPDQNTGELKNETLCIRVVTQDPLQPARIMLWVIPVSIFLSLHSILGRVKVYKGKRADDPTLYVCTEVNRALVLGHQLLNLVVIYHAFFTCEQWTSFTYGPLEIHLRSPILIAISMYIFFRLLLNIVGLSRAIKERKNDAGYAYLLNREGLLVCCGPGAIAFISWNRQNGQKLIVTDQSSNLMPGSNTSNHNTAAIRVMKLKKMAVVYAPDIVFLGLYVGGIVWQYLAGKCHWYDGPFVFTMSVGILDYLFFVIMFFIARWLLPKDE